MSSDKPVTVAVATYNNKASAEQDYDAIRGIKHHGQRIGRRVRDSGRLNT